MRAEDKEMRLEEVLTPEMIQSEYVIKIKNLPKSFGAKITF